MSKKRVIIPNNLSEDFIQDTTDKDIKVNIDEVTIKRGSDDKLYVDRNELNLEEIADRLRPFVKEGETTATNDDDVAVTDNVFHTGKVSVGTDEFEEKYDFNTININSKVNNTDISFSEDVVFVFLDAIEGTDDLEDYEYVNSLDGITNYNVVHKVKTIDKAFDICRRSQSNRFNIVIAMNTALTINKKHNIYGKSIVIHDEVFSPFFGPKLRFGTGGSLFIEDSNIYFRCDVYFNRNLAITSTNSNLEFINITLEGNITNPISIFKGGNIRIESLYFSQINQSLVSVAQYDASIYFDYIIATEYNVNIVKPDSNNRGLVDIYFSESFSTYPTNHINSNIKFGENIRVHWDSKSYQGKNFLVAGDEQYLNIIKGVKPLKLEDIQNDVEGDDVQFLTGLDANGGMWKVPKSLFVNGNWVTIDTDQTITGQKNFKSYITFEDFLGATHPYKIIMGQSGNNFGFGKMDGSGSTPYMVMSSNGIIYIMTNDLILNHNLGVAGNANISGDYNTGGNGTITGNLAVNGNTVLLDLNTKMGFNTPAPTHVIHISTLSPDALRIQAPLVLQNTSRVLTWNSSTGNVGYSDIVIKRRDTYTGTTAATGLVTITFTTPFTAIPNIQATQIGGSNTNILKVTAVTTTNVTVQVVNRVNVSYTNVTGAIVDIIATEK